MYRFGVGLEEGFKGEERVVVLQTSSQSALHVSGKPERKCGDTYGRNHTNSRLIVASLAKQKDNSIRQKSRSLEGTEL